MSYSLADTNLLLYSISQAREDAGKRDVAQQVLAGREVALSVQALEEFYVQATRATRKDRIQHDTAVAFIRVWKRFRIQPRSEAVMDRALEIGHRYHLAYWDAAVVAAAVEASCGQVLTEDLQHGAVIAGVRIRNPFLRT